MKFSREITFTAPVILILAEVILQIDIETFNKNHWHLHRQFLGVRYVSYAKSV
jgi:hypothetical protein